MLFFTVLYAGYSNGFAQTNPDSNGRSIGQILPEPVDAEYPVYLYFVDKNNGYLIGEAGEIRDKENTPGYCRRIVEALISGPASGLTRTIPEGTELRAVYLGPERTAYVDLTGEVSSNHPGGVRTELMTVYSIVNTLILNVSGVDRVKLLIDGQEADTLAGHIDIRFPLTADMLLVR